MKCDVHKLNLISKIRCHFTVLAATGSLLYLTTVVIFIFVADLPSQWLVALVDHDDIINKLTNFL